MCGIVGYIGPRDALEVIVSGLEKLEYRGYDSAGVAVCENGSVSVIRAVGKLQELKDTLRNQERKGRATSGIGHTRWATHGKPSENNAHPHTAGRISLIHNGIIENYTELKSDLEKKGCVFKSETDTEIVAQLINYNMEQGESLMSALKTAISKVRGSYAFLILDHQDPERILVAKNATPIVLGIGEDEMFIASDIPAILNYTRSVVILEDGDIAEVTATGYQLENNGSEKNREVQTITWDPVTAQKGGFKHFMLKEIHDQVSVVQDTFRGRIERDTAAVYLPEITFSDKEIKAFSRIVLVACGTAWHACLTARFYLETYTGLPVDVDYASEFRYRTLNLDSSCLAIAVSQSGETADTLAAIEYARSLGARTMAVCNVLGSSIPRKVENVLYTNAGPEISVASTKAFTTQLVSLYLLSLYLGEKRGVLTADALEEHIEALVVLPGALAQAVQLEEQVEAVARSYHQAKDFLFIGRGICFPIALEGALKLKEISYIHAEGYPAGEMKHGPIALIDEHMPVVVVLQRSDSLFEKTLSNLMEVESRGGRIIAITDAEGHAELKRVSQHVIEVPYLSGPMSPILLTIPLQFLAYYVAVINGTDVDLPRNLAKSVTVE